jgi:methylglutaconyl-CoA hydratase
VISPYVIRAIGRRAAQRYFLSAEKFSAREALRIGLVHEVVAAEHLSSTVTTIAAELLKSGPHAVAAAKRLIVDVADSRLDDALVEETARRIAAIRVSPEGREGIAAFLEKRKPGWMSGDK